MKNINEIMWRKELNFFSNQRRQILAEMQENRL